MKINSDPNLKSQLTLRSGSQKSKIKSDESLNLRFISDIRALIVAHIFVSRIENNNIEQSISGYFRVVHLRTLNLRILLWGILVTLFFIHKPEWCLLQPDIEKNCQQDYSGVEYHLMLTTYINSGADTMISFLIMFIFVTYQYFKSMNVPQFGMERIKLNLMGGVFLIALILRIFVFTHLILPTAFENSIKVIFVLTSSSMVIRTCVRFGKLVKYTFTIIGFLFVTVFWFAIYFRIRFNGVEFEDGDSVLVYQFSFTSFFRSYMTMFTTIFGNTFPNMPIALYNKCIISFFIFWFYVILTSVVLMSLIGGIFFFIYNEILVLNYEDVCKKYPDFEDRISFIMNQEFSSYEGIDKVVNYYLSKQKKKKEKTWLIKFKRAVKKLQIIRIISKIDQDLENYYQKIRRTFIFMCIDLLFSFYAMLIPVVVESLNTPREMADYIFLTEIFAIIFLIDQYLTFKLEKRENVFNFHYIVELVSNLTMMFTIHLILLEKVNLEDQNVYQKSRFFILWKIACLLKVFRINDIFMNFIGYKIIIRTITDVYPLIQDLLTLFIIVVLFAATIFMSIFGGKMNDEYLHYHQRITGSKYEGSVNLNYNDIVSSMIKISSMTFLGFNHILEDAIVLGYLIRRSRNDVAIFRLFTIFIYLVMEIFIMNILIGIILSLTAVYLNNTAELDKQEKLLISENDILHWIIDEVNFETSLAKQERLKKMKQKKSRVMKEMKEIINLDIEKLRERQYQRKKELKEMIERFRKEKNESINTENL